MTRTLRFGRWPSGVRIALLIGLAVVVPCVLLIIHGVRAYRVDEADARGALRERLEETLRRDVVEKVDDHLDAAVREAAKHVPAEDPSDPRCSPYLKGLEATGTPFKAVFAVTRSDRILDSDGTIVWARREDPAVHVDEEARQAIVARIVSGEIRPEELRAFALAHPIGLDADDYPVTLGFLHLRAERLADAKSPDAPFALLDLMESMIRHSHLAEDALREKFAPDVESLRSRFGEDGVFAARAARIRDRARQLTAIRTRIQPRRDEFLNSRPGHEVVPVEAEGATIFLHAPVLGVEGRAPRFLLVLVLDRARFERSVLGPSLTGLSLPPGFRAIRLDGTEDDRSELRLVEGTLAPPLDDVRVAIVAEAPDAIASALRFGGNRSLVFLILAIVGAAAAGWLTLRTVSGELRLAKRTSDFVSNVTHELKTPLTAIRMFVETLQDGRVKDDSERRECLDVIARETDRLQERIERVLKLARLGAGSPTFDLHPGCLTEVLREAADTCRARLTGTAGSELIEEIEDSLGPVNLDRRAMGEAVANLLANAVKYSPRDRCRLSLTGRRIDGEVIVEVRDEGIGIPASEHERIFERFYRVDTKHVREAEGTGLGLALVRRIVEAHDGRISLKSAEGEGSTFRMHLPVVSGEDETS